MSAIAKWIVLTGAATTALLLISVSGSVQAQAYPTRPIRFVVPYVPGGGVDFVGRTVAQKLSMYFGTAPSTAPHVRSGKLRALGVTAAKRSPTIPDVPTIAESGLPGFEQSAWHGLLAPARTPQPIITKLHAEVVRILRLPDVAERFAAQGVNVVASSPTEFAAFIKQDVAKYEKLVKTAGIRID